METFLDFVRGLKNRIAIRLSGSERAMLDEAERTLVNLLRGEAGSVAGEKYSFVRATDAEQIARAQELEAQGENAKTIWSETHLTRGRRRRVGAGDKRPRRKAAAGRRRAGRNGRPPCGLSGAPGAVRGCAGYSGYKRKIGNAAGKRKGEILFQKKNVAFR